MLAQAIGSQLINVGGYVVLGWLLLEGDFGLFALAMTVAEAAALLERIGINAILVRRYRGYTRWANPALWISLTIGLFAGAAMAAAAPLAGLIYGKKELVGLTLILALTLPLDAVCAVPEARIRAELRFRLLAAVRFSFLTGWMLLTILFAALEFGAYSFVLPRPILQAARLVFVWWIARPPVRWSPQFRRWRYMLTDAAHLGLFNASNFLMNQSSYVILGLLHTDAVVGLFYFGFTVSQRAVVTLTFNLRDVLFPALSSIQDYPARQVAAFLRASRLAALVGIPACLLLAASAEPGFNAFLPERWRGAIPVVQILSLGAVFRLMGRPALALILAQGRFRTLLVLGIALCVLFILCVTAGALIGEATSVAVAMALFMAIADPVQMYVAIRPGGGRWRDVRTVFAAPLGIGIAAVATAWLIGNALPAMPGRDWAQLVVIPLVSAPLYIALIRRAARDDWADLMERFRSLLRRRRAA
jgi:PST family polysaccharide transporter